MAERERLNGEEQPKRRKFAPLDIERVLASARRKGVEDDPENDAPRSEPEGSAFEEVGEVGYAEQEAALSTWEANPEGDFIDDQWCRLRGKLIPRHVAEKIKVVEIAWAQTASSRINVGKRLQDMKKALKHGEWIQAFEGSHMPFSLRTAQEFMHLARHRVLGDTRNSAYLPTKRQPQIILARSGLPDSVLEDLMKSGTINPTMTIKDVQNLYVFKLPDMLTELLVISEEHSAAEVAKSTGYQLWREHKEYTPDNLAALKSWVREFREAYIEVERECQAEWEEQLQIELNDQEEEREAEQLARAWKKKQGRAQRTVKRWRRR
jgi:Protein of unknown function (DUF3102)